MSVTPPKRSLKTCVIKICCTPEQKEWIKRQAALSGVKSVAKYSLDVVLSPGGAGYGFQRRKAEGPLINLALYRQLGELIVALERQETSDRVVVEEAIELVHALRREIALQRIRYAFDSALEPI